jgi:uncharacterized protein
MVRSFITTALCAALLVLSASGAWALDAPPYAGRVTDLAGMMSPATRQALDAHLAELEKTDSTQVAVLTVPSLEGDSIEAFSMRVAEAWKVGQKDTDNGALLVVSKEDRKVRIEVGYGLEGVLTDILAGQIVDNVITPRFKAGDFDGGFAAGVAAISGAVRGEYVATRAPGKRGKSGVLPLIVLPMLLIIFFTEVFGRGKRAAMAREERAGLTRDGRTAHGSGLGGAASTLFLLSMLGGGRGGGGGFGGGGGGFGGFGGGGFGGGGASGGW